MVHFDGQMCNDDRATTTNMSRRGQTYKMCVWFLTFFARSLDDPATLPRPSASANDDDGAWSARCSCITCGGVKGGGVARVSISDRIEHKQRQQ